MHALIIANGSLPQASIIRSLKASSDFLICADGGANHARTLRLRPDIILGDMDSITASTRKHFSQVPLLQIKDQYSTDLEKAVMFCIAQRIGSADIVGAFGDRIDHSTGSLGCFEKFRTRIQLRMIDSHGVVTLVDRVAKFKSRKGQKISLIPLSRCKGVKTRNLLYKLDGEVLQLGFREGISNEATASRVTVSVKTGTLLLYVFR